MEIKGKVRTQKTALEKGIITSKELKQMGNGYCPTVDDFNESYCLKGEYLIRLHNNRDWKRVNEITNIMNPNHYSQFANQES